MKKLCLILILLPALSLLASGPQATSKTAGSTETKTATNGNPVDIDITLDSSGKPTATPDKTTLHRARDDRARWNNRLTNKDCDVIFSPFGLPNYRISHGRSTTSGPIVGPDGTYEYMLVCGDAEKLPMKRKKTKPADPTIIVTY
jgi:hypothetical protein